MDRFLLAKTAMKSKGSNLRGYRSRVPDRSTNFHRNSNLDRDYSVGPEIFMTHDILLRSNKDDINKNNLNDLIYDYEDENEDDFDKPEESVYKELLESTITD